MGHTDENEPRGRGETAPAMLERVDAILDALGREEVLTLEQMSRRIGVPGSSLHRILQRLVGLGWVERDGFSYRLGLRMRELGHRMMQLDPRYRVALPLLYELRDATGLSVHLSVLSGTESVAVENIWGRGRVPLISGLRHPAHATASGKVLLAAQCAVDGGDTDLQRLTTATIGRPDQLRAELERVRESGLATAREELAVGLASIAVPIGPADEATAALALSGPVEEMNTDAVVPTLRATAARIYTAMRHLATPSTKA